MTRVVALRWARNQASQATAEAAVSPKPSKRAGVDSRGRPGEM
jgi:hypothetical protein